jgi:1-acyl-sn-glycerol-3-phosphate acyltransferase
VFAGGAISDQLRELESRLDALLGNAAEREREALGRLAGKLRRVEREGAVAATTAAAAAGVAGRIEREAYDDDAREGVFDVAREVLSSDYYLRQWGRVAMRDRSEQVDDFGLDPKFAARLRPLFDFLYARYWRVEAHDIDRVPDEGRVILCANHSGAVPYDGAMLATALRREHPARRELRWLAEDFVFHFPFLGVFMNRIGAVRACQENAERLLRKDTVVGVFPEGVKGVAKLFRERYRLQRFGRGGHVKLAIRTRTPIVPVAIVGAEETHPLIAPTGLLAKFLGLPYVPITPTFPWLGPLGLLPTPSKWKIFFLDPISMDDYAPDAADDEVLVGRLNEKIRTIIQEELDRALRERRSVFRG